jgi:folylpolyglutamate synthase/dihydropteroate synthase
VIFTRYLNNPRSVPPEELLCLWRELTDAPAELQPTPAEAWDAVRRSASADDLIAIAGSFFIAAEMRTEIARHPFDDCGSARQ